jgi:hypothetical protein
MKTTWDRILEALASLAPDPAPRVLGPREVRLFIDRFVRRFVADRRSLFWWEALTMAPTETTVYTDATAGYPEIEGMLRRAGALTEIILIVTDENPDPAGALVGPWSAQRRLLEEMHYFEFALTDADLRWAIFDTHHNGLLLVEGPVNGDHETPAGSSR